MKQKPKTPAVFRQGDVLIREVSDLPKTIEHQIDPTLARGEATGHAHKLTGDGVIFRDTESQRLFVKVMSSAVVTHEEHKPVTLERGVYEVIGQREYSPAEIRRVAD